MNSILPLTLLNCQSRITVKILFQSIFAHYTSDQRLIPVVFPQRAWSMGIIRHLRSSPSQLLERRSNLSTVRLSAPLKRTSKTSWNPWLLTSSSLPPQRPRSPAMGASLPSLTPCFHQWWTDVDATCSPLPPALAPCLLAPAMRTPPLPSPLCLPRQRPAVGASLAPLQMEDPLTRALYHQCLYAPPAITSPLSLHPCPSHGLRCLMTTAWEQGSMLRKAPGSIGRSSGTPHRVPNWVAED